MNATMEVRAAESQMVDCPKCDMGYDGCDEDGRYFACYFCCCTGRIDAATARGYWRDRAWGSFVSAEAAIRRDIAPQYDPETGDPMPTLRRQREAREAARALPVTFDDDLPF